MGPRPRRRRKMKNPVLAYFCLLVIFFLLFFQFVFDLSILCIEISRKREWQRQMLMMLRPSSVLCVQLMLPPQPISRSLTFTSFLRSAQLWFRWFTWGWLDHFHLTHSSQAFFLVLGQLSSQFVSAFKLTRRTRNSRIYHQNGLLLILFSVISSSIS